MPDTLTRRRYHSWGHTLAGRAVRAQLVASGADRDLIAVRNMRPEKTEALPEVVLTALREMIIGIVTTDQDCSADPLRVYFACPYQPHKQHDSEDTEHSRPSL